MNAEDLETAFLQTQTLLYVEDDAATREEIGEFLQRRAGSVVLAADGAAGLAAFRARPAQVVITDIRMPRMDGLAMAREIRSLDPGVLIIVTTAFEDADYLTRSVAAGIDHYVMKPIQRARLEFALLTCAHRLRMATEVRRPAAGLTPPEQEGLLRLTPREREVLACIGRGMPSRAIAQGLGISFKTVHAHQAHLMLKLDLHKSTALAAFAVRAGMV